jgi:hypothetical protein
MERVQKIDLQEALRILRTLQAEATRPHSRSHLGAQDDNALRIRAVKGICGQCSNLVLEGFLGDGKKRVRLRCQVGGSPLDLYRKTELGETPVCAGYSGRS